MYFYFYLHDYECISMNKFLFCEMILTGFFNGYCCHVQICNLISTSFKIRWVLAYTFENHWMLFKSRWIQFSQHDCGLYQFFNIFNSQKKIMYKTEIGSEIRSANLFPHGGTTWTKRSLKFSRSSWTNIISKNRPKWTVRCKYGGKYRCQPLVKDVDSADMIDPSVPVSNYFEVNSNAKRCWK